MEGHKFVAALDYSILPTIRNENND